jgi:endonuclease-8
VPEGDTVWLSAQKLRGAIRGAVVIRADLRVPRYATADLSGRRVLDVVSRGKHMLTRFDDGRTLHTHFRMDGTWRLVRTDSPPGGRSPGGAAHDVRVVIETAGWTALGYRLPVVELLPTAEEDRAVGHLGPDLLGPDWDPDEVLRRLAARPARQVGPALLDQRNLAGIGNLYKSESLFLRGVSPWTAVGEVTDLRALVVLAQRLLEANKHRWEQVTTGDPRPGRQRWVFDRAGRECQRCGTPIRCRDQGEPEAPEQARRTYWCPHCQPGPAPP